MRHDRQNNRDNPTRRLSLDPEAEDISPPPPDRDSATTHDGAAKESKKPVAWKDLPQKQQLAIITLSRLSEPLVQTSLQVSHFSTGPK
jgi:hypothetical protein